MKRLLIILSILFAVSNCLIAQTEVSNYPVIAAISDIHVNRGGNWQGKIDKTFAILAQRTPKLDAIFIAGDITHNGTESEFELVKQLVSEKIPADIPVYYCMGNHDWWANPTNAGELFEQILQQPLNQYIKLKDYPFILISMENKNQETAYGEKTRQFLTGALASAASDFPDKPIFVFMHVPNKNTVYGSYEIGGSDAWSTSTVSDIIEQYPQAIAISGHSHYLLSDERSIHQDKFTSINDGSATYAETEEGLYGGTRPKDSEKIVEGCFISLDGNKDVTVTRWDFYNNKEIKSPWKITAPHDGTNFLYKNRTGEPAPYFGTADKVTISFQDASTCIVGFPMAKDDDDNVIYYRVEVLDETQSVLSADKLLSDYYLPLKNTVQTHTLKNLKKDKSYIVKVVAIDAFGNESEPILSNVFSGQDDSVQTNLIKNGNFEGLLTLHRPNAGTETINWNNNNPAAPLVGPNFNYTPGDSQWRLKKPNISAFKTDFYPAGETGAGSQSLKLQVDQGYSSSNPTHAWYNNAVYQSVSVDKTKKYEVKLWAKGNSKLYLQFYTNYSGGSTQAIGGQPNKAFNGTEKWVQYTFTLDVAGRDNSIITDDKAYTERTIFALGLQSSNSETETETRYVWIDNVEVYAVEELPTGILPGEEETPQVPVYVNNGTIYFNINEPYHVTVYDILGKTIGSKTIEPGQSLPIQAQGCFILKLENTRGITQTQKIIIK